MKVNNNNMKYYALCPDCGGDGKEICHNPDHGFLAGVMSFMGANESACPCCGHDENHKMKKFVNGRYVYNTCDTCDGVGKVDKNDYYDFIHEYAPNEDVEDINKHCIFDNNK